MSISSINSSLPLLGPQPSAIDSVGQAIDSNSQAFGTMLNNMLAAANAAQLNGDKAIVELQSGRAENLHEVMIAMEKADLSMRTLMQIRNKAKTAYDEMMRIQL